MTYLIIGGLGIVGYNLAKELVKYNDKVIVIDNLSKDDRYNVDENFTRKVKKSHILKNDNYKFYKLDISKDNLNFVFEEKIDYVIFLANMAHDYYSILENDYTSLNKGLKNVLKYVKRDNIKFILGSSSAIYDMVDKKVLSETDPIVENSNNYSKAIKTNEDILIDSKVKSLILRIGIPYGEGLLPNTFLYEILNKLYMNEPVLGFEYEGNVPRDYIYIDDLINYLLKALKYFDKVDNFEIINIGSGTSLSDTVMTNYLVGGLNQILKGYEKKISEHKFKNYQNDKQKLDISKAKKLLNYKPLVFIDNQLSLSVLIHYYEKLNICNVKLTDKLKKEIDTLDNQGINEYEMKYHRGFISNLDVYSYLSYQRYKLNYSLNQTSIKRLESFDEEDLLIEKEDLISRDNDIERLNEYYKNYYFGKKMIYDTHEDRMSVINYIDKLLDKKKIDCLFCKIINKEIKSEIIYENDLLFVFLDINPTTNGDTLIIPKKHFENIFEVDNDTLLEINKISKMLYKTYKEKLNCIGLTLSTNLEYGQEIRHFHVHFIPRYENDEVKHLSNKKILKDLTEIKNMLK